MDAHAVTVREQKVNVDVGQLVEATRESVRGKIAHLEALVSTSSPERSNGAQLSNRVELSKARATTKR